MMELLDQLELLITKRRRLVQRLRDLVRELGCDWLLDQPGLGPLRAAELLDAGFLQSPGPNGFARLAGLAPVEFASGERSRHINAFVRRQHLFTTLMDWAQWLSMPRSGIAPARDYYARKRAEGKTRCTALRCLARQQINRLFRLRERHLSSSLNGVPTNEVKAG